jgi:uncharacterized delta-60 repeat protein
MPMKWIFTLAAVMFFSILCRSQPGSLNPQFNGGTINTTFDASGAQAEDLVVQPDGKVVAAGLAYDAGIPHFAIARYLSNGSLDASFGIGGKVITLIQNGSWAHAIALQHDGKILVGGMTENGTSSSFAMSRYLQNGMLDNTFGNGGIVISSFLNASSEIYDLKVLSDGRIIAGGRVDNGFNIDFALARYLPDGSQDVSFAGGQVVFPVGPGNDFAQSVEVQADGKILLAGTAFNGINHNMAVTRFTNEGIPDFSFGTDGKVITAVGATESFGFDIALQPDGKILFTGHMYNALPYRIDVAVVRYTNMGLQDATFGMNGIVVTDVANTNDDGVGVAVQNDGKIIVAGHTTNDGFKDFLLIRYLSNGVPDIEFGSHGISTTAVGNYDDIAFAMKLSGLNIYVAGISNTTPTGVPGEFAIASFINDASPLPVRLLSFTAEKEGSSVVLQWNTDNEDRFQEFIVERSSDGRIFENLYRVSASGIQGLNKYSAIDQHPLPDINYYRLKQVDRNGTFSFSQILPVRMNGRNSFDIFPNPVTSLIHLQLPEGLQGNILIEISEISGRVSKRLSMQLNRNATSTSIDVSSLPAGMYLIHTRTSEGIFSRKFLKH